MTGHPDPSDDASGTRQIAERLLAAMERRERRADGTEQAVRVLVDTTELTPAQCTALAEALDARAAAADRLAARSARLLVMQP